MKEIKIEDFITIRILELNKENCVCFVDDFNEKYFYRDDNNRIYAHQSTYIFYYHLYFQKAKIIYRGHLDDLEKAIYRLHEQLIIKIPRAEIYKTYYFIENDFEVNSFTELNDDIDKKHYKNYNYFKSKEEATKCAEKLKEYLIELRKEEAMKENK